MCYATVYLAWAGFERMYRFPSRNVHVLPAIQYKRPTGITMITLCNYCADEAPTCSWQI